jgi:hypothetical protein
LVQAKRSGYEPAEAAGVLAAIGAIMPGCHRRRANSQVSGVNATRLAAATHDLPTIPLLIHCDPAAPGLLDYAHLDKKRIEYSGIPFARSQRRQWLRHRAA